MIVFAYLILSVTGVFVADLLNNWSWAFMIIVAYLFIGMSFIANLTPMEIKNKNSDNSRNYVWAWQELTELNHMLDLITVGPTPPVSLKLRVSDSH